MGKRSRNTGFQKKKAVVLGKGQRVTQKRRRDDGATDEDLRAAGVIDGDSKGSTVKKQKVSARGSALLDQDEEDSFKDDEYEDSESVASSADEEDDRKVKKQTSGVRRGADGGGDEAAVKPSKKEKEAGVAERRVARLAAKDVKEAAKQAKRDAKKKFTRKVHLGEPLPPFLPAPSLPVLTSPVPTLAPPLQLWQDRTQCTGPRVDRPSQEWPGLLPI